MTSTLIGGRYAPQQEVARSVTATVYRAHDRHSDVSVAVKVLHRQATDLTRFSREVSILAQLRHPGIVRYIGHGTTAAGDAYLVTEWLSGETLEARLRASQLEPREAVDIGWQIASALRIAHDRGLLHRDIKPGNVMLVVDRVKLLDFGVARNLRAQQRATATGALVGTPQYMAPEQARGEDELDARADVFALGAVLYECITGEVAFDDDNLTAILAKVMLHEPAPAASLVPGLPEPLSALLRAMLAKPPALRPIDATDVATRLRELLDLPAEVWGNGATSAPPRRRRALRGPEQRVVTVAVVGTADSPADATGATLRAVAPGSGHGALIALSEQFGGTITGLASGASLVVFAGAAAPTDQAARAARFALAMRDERPDLPLALATGRGVVSRSTLSGQVVDQAAVTLARIMTPRVGVVTADRGGGIRIDDLTAGLLDAEFDVRAEGDELLLRGDRDAGGARTLCGRTTPLVGRKRELQMLEAALVECADEQVARAVLVTGPAGVGKSRLRRELVAKIRAKGWAGEVVMGRAEASAAGAPYGLLAPAIRRLAGILSGEPLAVQRRRLRARVGRYLPAAEVERVAAFLGEMVGVAFDEAAVPQLVAARADRGIMNDAIHDAWETWLAAECATAPLLLVLEDLHGGDRPSIQLVDRALRNLHDCRFMVLALARSNVYEQFPDLWQRRDVLELRLGKLSRRAQIELIDSALGHAAVDATNERLIALADGNAFYLEELIRAVASGSDELPETVLGMVQSRLDQVGELGKDLLRAASVFGESFWRSGVAWLLGDRARGLDEALAELLDRELVTTRPSSMIPDEPEYAFPHTIVREAAYAMLTREDRRAAHRAAGAWLEAAIRPRAGADETPVAEQASAFFAGALAEHFWIGGQPDKASAWYRRAAERALDASDFVTAAAAAARAHVANPEASAAVGGALALLVAEASWWRGDYRGALTHAREAAAGLEPATGRWFRAMEHVAECACRLGEFDFVDDWVAAVSATGVPAAVEPDQLRCLCRGVLRLMFAGRGIQAHEALARIDALAASLARFPPHVAAWYHQLSALRAYFSGDPSGNLLQLQRALACFEVAGDVRNACQTSAYLGFGLIELGAYERATVTLRDALAAAERLGLQLVAANARENLAIALAGRGELEEAWTLELAATEAYAAHGEPRKEGGCRRYLCKIALARGDLDRAAIEARRAVELLAETPPLLAGARADLARVLLARGQVAEALVAAREAMALAAELEEIDEGEALLRLTYAEALDAAGEREEARCALSVARARLELRAARIADGGLRESFVSGVPENRRTLELEAAWSADPRTRSTGTP